MARAAPAATGEIPLIMPVVVELVGGATWPLSLSLLLLGIGGVRSPPATWAPLSLSLSCLLAAGQSPVELDPHPRRPALSMVEERKGIGVPWAGLQLSGWYERLSLSFALSLLGLGDWSKSPGFKAHSYLDHVRSLSLSLSLRGLGSAAASLATSPVRTRTPAVLGGLSFPPVYVAPRGLAVRGVNGRGRKRHAPPHYFERGA